MTRTTFLAIKRTAPARPRIGEVVHTQSKRMGRPPLRGDQREVILDTAAHLFSEKGFDAGSIGDLAAALGISKAAIYHYFSTKQEILDAIILRALESLRASTEMAVAAASTPTDQLRAFMRAHARHFESRYHDFLAMFVAFGNMQEQNQRLEAVRLRGEHESMLRAILKTGVADGTFRKSDIGTAARAILSMLNWMARWFHPGGAQKAEDVVDGYFKLIIDGLVMPSAQPAAGKQVVAKKVLAKSTVVRKSVQRQR
jgi:AcrR family transcriptional regulator